MESDQEHHGEDEEHDADDVVMVMTTMITLLLLVSVGDEHEHALNSSTLVTTRPVVTTWTIQKYQYPSMMMPSMMLERQ